ncbi:MAG: acyl-CoA desaturase [Chloroflexi bacterium]|nr:acyl-CoA desaturase [Chloroflexota bacterium]
MSDSGSTEIVHQARHHEAVAVRERTRPGIDRRAVDAREQDSISGVFQPPVLAKYQQLTVKEGSRAYAELRAKVMAHGILDRSYGYYAVLITVVLTAFFLSAYQIVMNPISFALVGWSLLFACCNVQLAGILHDAGPRTIFTATRLNDVIGHTVGSLLAMPFYDWRHEHNKHHAHPNQEEEDPDIDLPFISLTRERYLARTGLSKLLAPYQMYLWYPLSSFVGITKRLYGFAYFKREIGKDNVWQFGVYLLGLIAWFVLPFLAFDPAKAIFVLVLTNFASGAYLANIFAPNHKGMPFIEKDAKFSFMEQQIITSRNIKPGFLTDIIYVGLNYQIEHHLFPTCPRNRLKLLTPHVREVCRKYNLEFTEVGVFESNRILLAELNEVTRTAAAT